MCFFAKKKWSPVSKFQNNSLCKIQLKSNITKLNKPSGSTLKCQRNTTLQHCFLTCHFHSLGRLHNYLVSIELAIQNIITVQDK